jgi:hypothetical protein
MIKGIFEDKRGWKNLENSLKGLENLEANLGDFSGNLFSWMYS